AFPGDNATAGLAAAASISGGAVSRVEVANGIITVVFNAKVDNYDLKLTPTGGGGSITWSCNGGSIPVKYLPLNCR
ncbi:MAG: pilin, partial [Candidatus Accumulibacter sp.]|nr:pilin [Accumulibacter sp.]